MKLAYICSPYAGNISENVRFARAACRFAIKEGCAPVAPHLLYPQLLNDAVPAERDIGLQMGGHDQSKEKPLYDVSSFIK